jgi:hypothetical protein
MNNSSAELRNQYIECFGAEKVDWACRKANWHKARASKWGCEAHFNGWQWLDLCESQSWNCAYCHQKQPLEPHHRHELHKGGLNTVENLDAICKACHERIHEWPDDVSDAWMTYQNALLERFRRVALECGAVRLACGTREENQTRCRGVLLEFHAPRIGVVPLRGILPRGDWKMVEPVAAINDLTRDWWENRAGAQVQWHAGGMWEERVVLTHLAAVEPISARGQQKVKSDKKRAPERQLALAF